MDLKLQNTKNVLKIKLLKRLLLFYLNFRFEFKHFGETYKLF
jgi:hypothetical protein